MIHPTLTEMAAAGASLGVPAGWVCGYLHRALIAWGTERRWRR